MPFVLIFVGLLLSVSAVRNTTGDLLTLVKGEFSGDANFAHWLLAIIAIGSIGYIAPLRSLSRAFLFLVIVGLVVHNGGLFTKLQSAISARK